MVIDIVIILLLAYAAGKTTAKVVTDISHGLRGTMPPATRERLEALRQGVPVAQGPGFLAAARAFLGWFRPTAPGVRMYLGRVWGDVWVDMLDKRADRRARRGSAQVGPARRFAYGWVAGGWAAAWTWADGKYGPPTQTSAPAGSTQAPAGGFVPPQRGPAPGATQPTQPSGSVDDDVIDAEVVPDSPTGESAGSSSSPGPDAPGPASVPLALTAHPHQQGDFDMSEATGLASAIAYAEAKANVMDAAASDEAFGAYLVSTEHGAEILEALGSALEATTGAGNAWRYLQTLLAAGTTVADAYAAVSHAGNKQHLLSE